MAAMLDLEICIFSFFYFGLCAAEQSKRPKWQILDHIVSYYLMMIRVGYLPTKETTAALKILENNNDNSYNDNYNYSNKTNRPKVHFLQRINCTSA